MVSPAASLRGGAVGALTVALAVAAHGMAGGGFPAGSAWVFLAIVGLGTAAITTIPHSRVQLVAAFGGLFLGQMASHTALVVGNPHEMMHGHSILPSPTMLGFHVAASAVSAALVCIAERLYGPITSIVRAVLDPPLPLPRRASRQSYDARRAPSPLHFFMMSISRRGPPQTA